MADQNFSVKCGFFDAVNGDRTYSAEDMNKPYSRVIADGVFATPAGQPSTDLQVVASGSGMNITVQAGQAIVAAKWFENSTPVIITVPANTALYNRIDSVIAQVDKRASGRSGNIVYRTGTASSTPQAPEITQSASVMEYRIANILVAPSAGAITQSVITDLRGVEFPWVAGLIQQVDTSTLFEQYAAAYAEQFAAFTAAYNEYKRQQQADWSAFIQTLSDDLTCTMNMLELKHSHTAEASETVIDIGIREYNPATDILEVYINGLKAGAEDYTATATQITLTTALEEGNTVLLRVLKAVIGGDISSVISIIERMQSILDDLGGISDDEIDDIIGGLD